MITVGEVDRVKQLMNLYRMGEIALPREYVAAHYQAALASLADITDMGYRILFQELVDDGWMDGMQVLRLVVEDKQNKLKDIRYSDDNGGSWFEKYPGGGQGLIKKASAGPGHL